MIMMSLSKQRQHLNKVNELLDDWDDQPYCIRETLKKFDAIAYINHSICTLSASTFASLFSLAESTNKRIKGVENG